MVVQITCGIIKGSDEKKYNSIALMLYPYQSGVKILSNIVKNTVPKQANITINGKYLTGFLIFLPKNPKQKVNKL